MNISKLRFKCPIAVEVTAIGFVYKSCKMLRKLDKLHKRQRNTNLRLTLKGGMQPTEFKIH